MNEGPMSCACAPATCKSRKSFCASGDSECPPPPQRLACLLRRSRFGRCFLVGPGVVATARSHLIPLFSRYLDLDLVIAAIQLVICRIVGQRVLIPQFLADILK